MLRRRCAVALVVCLGLASLLAAGTCVAGASEPSTQPGDYSEPYRYAPPLPAFGERPRDPFHRGTFDFSLAGEALLIADAHHDSLGFADVGVDYFVANGVSAGVQLGLSPRIYVAEGEDCFSGLRMNVRAYSGMLFVRAHLIHSPDFSLYVDGGIGGLHGEGPFPAQGSDNTWMQAIGAGVTLTASKNASWFLGARYVRLGPDFFNSARGRNFSGIQWYLGLSFRS